MSSWPLCRLIRVIAACSALASPAFADDLADFNAAVERAAAHNRAALGYLRTESVDLAAVELNRMKTAWGDLTGRFGATPPAALRDNKLYTETLVDVPVRIVTATMMLDFGRVEIARNSLQAIRLSLSNLRRESGIEILADCVLDYSAVMAVFLAYDNSPPDWKQPEMASELASRAAAVEKTAKRCDSLASEKVRAQPEFRRLIDGTLESLAFVPKVIETRDNDMLHRLIGELRAFDNLLVFRYG
ncbi:MAG TPA: hypothetical protein VM867_06785 [Xanthobacteraceae bacterium]|nr:hypothetical protein [Xanthobacteraceae bacterium]